MVLAGLLSMTNINIAAELEDAVGFIKGGFYFVEVGADVSSRLRTTCIIDSKLEATCSS